MHSMAVSIVHSVYSLMHSSRTSFSGIPVNCEYCLKTSMWRAFFWDSASCGFAITSPIRRDLIRCQTTAPSETWGRGFLAFARLDRAFDVFAEAFFEQIVQRDSAEF